MRNTLDLLQQLYAPDRPVSTPVFDTRRDLTPIMLSSWNTPVAQLRTVAERLEVAGFALVEAPRRPTQEDLRILAGLLGLGHPFTPPLYQRPGSVHVGASGISQLTATTDPDAPPHPATSRVAQGWHTDGTLQQLGEIRTSLLLCVQPAARGGESTLFNATGAFIQLAQRDRAAAAALMAPGVLTRTATVNSCDDIASGPAFALIDGQLLTRYARTDNDRWLQTAADPHAVARGLAVLDELAEPGSPYHLQFTLTAGQGLVLANPRICHGRTAYQDTPGASPRLMLRALFTAGVSIGR